MFKAYDTSLQVERALKVLKPEYLLGTDIRKRFHKEAIAMANLKHHNIVQVYDLGMEGMTLYIVMEYIPYGSARRYIQKHGALSVGQATNICLDIARALGYAHSQGIIHRDVKPDNILLTDQGAQLSDFGIAKDTMSDSNETKTNAMMGTVPYMSPEQRLNAKSITVQTDIYALVATFVHLLTSQDVTDLFVQEVRSEMVVGLPIAVQKVIEKGCCMDLKLRYASTLELIEDLESILSVEPCDPLSLVPMASPLMESAQLEELQRVWGRYTSDNGSEYTYSPLNGSHPNPTPSSGETWVNVHIGDEQADLEPESMSNAESSDIVDSTVQDEALRPKSSRIILWAFGGLIFLAWLMQSNRSSMQILMDDEGLLEMSAQDELVVARFEQAKQLIMDGQLTKSARLLSALHEDNPSDLVLHSVYTMATILQGQYTLPPTVFSASLNSHTHPESKPEVRELFQLISQSWDPSTSRSELESSWLKLLDKVKDPFFELSYLVSMRYAMGSDFDGVVEQYALRNKDLGVVPYVQSLADEMRGNTTDALKLIQVGVRNNPDDLNLLTKRAQLLWKEGQAEVAVDILQQVLESDSSFGPALLLLLELQHVQGDEVGFNQTFMMSFGDEVSKIDQLSSMYRAGELHFADQEYQEAFKYWDFCAREAKRNQSSYFVVLSSFRAVEAQMLLNTSEEVDINTLKEILSNNVLHDYDRKRFQMYRMYLIGLQALNNGNSTELERTLNELEADKDVPRFGLYLPGFQDLKTRALVHED